MGIFDRISKVKRTSDAVPARYPAVGAPASAERSARWMGGDLARQSLSDVDEEQMPGRDEIDRRIRAMLESQGQKPQVAEQIMMLSDDKKWMMLKGFKEQAQAENDVHPDDWVVKVHVEPTSENLETLSVLLGTYPVTWVEEFVLCGGTSALTGILELYQMKPRKSEADLTVVARLLRCIRALMNTELGMEAIIGGDTAHKLAIEASKRLGDAAPDAVSERASSSFGGGGRHGGLRQLALCVDGRARDSTLA